jgi:NADH:ubiquinone oxidoreductase subunit 3 (subunit A)
MDNFYLTPPVVFIIVFIAMITLSAFLSRIAFKPKEDPVDIGKSYGCGEDVPDARIQPDYTQFFPFAFFFTILHVVALVVTTAPAETTRIFSIAVIYIIGACTGLYILFRR